MSIEEAIEILTRIRDGLMVIDVDGRKELITTKMAMQAIATVLLDVAEYDHE
jgi:hypothetical protein